MVQKEEKRRQILDAATDEFLGKGFKAASMQNISDMAEVSKRTLYKYFSTKEELYAALVDEMLYKVCNMYPFDYKPDVAVLDQVAEVIDAKIELTLNDSFLKLSRLVIGEILRGNAPTPEQMAQFSQSESAFFNWIKLAQEDAQIKKDVSAEEVAEQFHSILKGQIFWPILFGMKQKEDIDIKQVKQKTLDFFSRSFLP